MPLADRKVHWYTTENVSVKELKAKEKRSLLTVKCSTI